MNLKSIIPLGLIFSTLIMLATPPAFASGIVMNFNDVELSTMVKFMSELTGRNFVLDERVKGKISIFSPGRLTADEAFSLFTSVLELKGFTVLPSGKVQKIVPIAQAKQSGVRLITKSDGRLSNDTVIARVFKLDYIPAQEALNFLQPTISKDGHIGSFGPANMLLVVDSAANIQKISDILSLIDSAQRREGAELVFLKNASADSIARTVSEWLSGRGLRQTTPSGGERTNASGGNALVGLVNVIPDNRLNAVLIFGPDKDKKDIKQLIAQLDITPPEASSKINVYYLEHTDALEMAKVLDAVLKGLPTATTGTAASSSGASPIDSNKVVITADKASNALIIMASPNDYANLLQVIRKLDRRSKQVYVQVLIAEVSLENSRELGVSSGITGAGAISKDVSLSGFYDPLGSLSSVISQVGGGTSGLVDLTSVARPINITAVLKALDKSGTVNILSTPNILTTDNKEAEINVGENVPFLSTSTQSNFGTTQSIERKDIGINLKIKPQISEGGFIRMDLYQEISAVKNDKGAAQDLITTKRSAKTNVVVKDKETIVIGGLIQDSEENITNKVPLLGDIPGLGWLFKTTSKNRKKTNLIIMLTPQVVSTASDMARITADQQKSFETGADVNKKPLSVQPRTN